VANPTEGPAAKPPHDPWEPANKVGAILDKPLADALLEDYKLKVTYAVDQTNRMQTQFQVMLTLQSALATTLIVSNTGSLTRGATWIVLLEIALSAAWVMVGVVGRRRAVANRLDLDAAGKKWAGAVGLGGGYRPVGSGQGVVWVGVLAPGLLLVSWSVLLLVLLFCAG
jgi:hypothetical protein